MEKLYGKLIMCIIMKKTRLKLLMNLLRNGPWYQNPKVLICRLLQFYVNGPTLLSLRS